eukprot:1552605-Pyramimonas_sp.AAC.1
MEYVGAAPGGGGAAGGGGGGGEAGGGGAGAREAAEGGAGHPKADRRHAAEARRAQDLQAVMRDLLEGGAGGYPKAD